MFGFEVLTKDTQANVRAGDLDARIWANHVPKGGQALSERFIYVMSVLSESAQTS
jgi:hypothetical protein